MNAPVRPPSRTPIEVIRGAAVFALALAAGGCVTAEIVAQLLEPRGQARADAQLSRDGLYRRARVAGRTAIARCTYTPPPVEGLRPRR